MVSGKCSGVLKTPDDDRSMLCHHCQHPHPHQPHHLVCVGVCLVVQAPAPSRMTLCRHHLSGTARGRWVDWFGFHAIGLARMDPSGYNNDRCRKFALHRLSLHRLGGAMKICHPPEHCAIHEAVASFPLVSFECVYVCLLDSATSPHTRQCHG